MWKNSEQWLMQLITAQLECVAFKALYRYNQSASLQLWHLHENKHLGTYHTCHNSYFKRMIIFQGVDDERQITIT